MLEYTGWVANVVLVIGVIGAGYKWRLSCLFFALGEGIYALSGYHTSRSDLTTISVLFAIVWLKNYFMWGRPE